jgi:hypothetical protein
VRNDELVLLFDEGHQEARDLGGVALVLFDRPLLALCMKAWPPMATKTIGLVASSPIEASTRRCIAAASN